MIPVQQTKSSRRSSILKISRPRSSLIHGGDSNNSAVDDSPTVTTKLKRRVSFAEKKHVKEFCDSFEQGTVWDNTYEESDSSHGKTNQSDKLTEISQLSSTNGYQIQVSTNVEVNSSITVTNKSPRRGKLVRQNAIDYDTIPLGIMNGSNNIRQCTILNDPDFLVNKENIPEVLKLSTAESSLIEDEEIVRPQRFSNSSPFPKFSIYCDDEKEKNNADNLNCSNYENVSMECTILAENSSPVCSNVENHESKQCKNNAFGNNKDLKQNSMATEKTQMSYDKSMGNTETIQRTKLSLKPSTTNHEKTQLFHNASMEITEAIPNVKFMCEPVCINDEKTQHFLHASMEITEPISNVKFMCEPNCINDEKTQHFVNKSMEITEPIPTATIMCKLNRVDDRKTQYFHNNSMEMTKVISQMKLPLMSNCDKTKIFHNKSMEITEALSNVEFSHELNCFQTKNHENFPDNLNGMKGPFLNEQCSIVSNRLHDEKTTVFHNKSMEMTEAISNMQFSTVPNCFTQEKLKVFHDDSLELTGVVPLVEFPLPQPNTINDERTTVFHDKSMEMTEAISNVECFRNPRCIDKEKTQLLDKSMEITKAVSTIKFPSSCNDNENKTRVFHNQSMEITEAITPMKLIVNETNLSNNAIPTLMRNTTYIDLSTNSTPHVEIDHNYFMEFTQAIQSIKRPYNSIENTDKPLELSSPVVKNPRYSIISEQKKPISMEDFEKLHQLLHQDLSKIHSSSETELLQDNHCLLMPNLVSNQQPTCHDNNATKMTEITAPILQTKIYTDEIQDTDRNFPVETSNPVEEIDPINSTLATETNDPNELLYNRDNFKENNSIKENQSSEIIKSLEPTNRNTIKQSKVIEPISSNSSCNNILEVPNLLQVFNKIIGETPITLENKDVPFEQGRFQSKYVNNAQTEDDITYDLTKPILHDKETEKTFLEYEEAPSFIYDQSESEQFLMNKEATQLLHEPLVPELSLTEVFTPINTKSLRENEITNIPLEQETSKIHDKEYDIKKVNCETPDKNKEEKINRRATFVVKKHDDCTDILKSTIHSEVESTERKITDQSNIDNEAFYAVNKEERKEIDNKLNDREINKEKLIGRSPIQVNLLDVDNKIRVNDNQPISNNVVSEKSREEHRRDVIRKLKKHEDESILVENDSIIRKIVQNAKEFADLRNKMKCMVKLGMGSTNNTEKEKTLKNVGASSIDTDNDEKGPYEILEEGLRVYEKNDECLWKIYDINPQVICIEYYKTALLLLIKFNLPDSSNEYEQVINVRIISRLNDKELAILKIIDNLIIERIDTQFLVKEFRTYEDIPKLIQYVTNEIKVIYDFYDDFEKVNRKYVIDILDNNRVSFVLRSQRMSKIIQLSIKLNFFTKIHPEDFESTSLLGSNIQNHVEKMAKSVKPGSSFLSTYIKQVEQLLNVY